MLHHVGIEVAPGDLERAVELFELLGFARVEPPPSLRDGFTWLERDGTQVHLMHEPRPVAPPRAHLAVVVPDFEPPSSDSARPASTPSPGVRTGVPRAPSSSPPAATGSS